MSRNHHSIPRYLQIAGLLRARLEDGEWPIGACLPSIEQLSAHFVVSPQTLRQALAALEREGLLERRQGIGTVVTAHPHEKSWLFLPTNWAEFVGLMKGIEPRLTLIEASDRKPVLRGGEGELAPSYKYLKRVHSRMTEARAFCVTELYLDSEIFLTNPRGFREELVIPLLDAMPGLSIARARQLVTIDVADTETALLLDIPVAGPIARVRRFICDANGRVIYLSQVVYRGDVLAIDMSLHEGSERP